MYIRITSRRFGYMSKKLLPYLKKTPARKFEMVVECAVDIRDKLTICSICVEDNGRQSSGYQLVSIPYHFKKKIFTLKVYNKIFIIHFSQSHQG